MLDHRINSLEQRLNLLDSTVRTLQQQAYSQSSTTAQPGRDPEVSLLRSEVELLKGRLRELECGIAHLDERTLSSSAKAARKSAGQQSADPCRLNPETPVEFSPRR